MCKRSKSRSCRRILNFVYLSADFIPTPKLLKDPVKHEGFTLGLVKVRVIEYVFSSVDPCLYVSDLKRWQLTLIERHVPDGVTSISVNPESATNHCNEDSPTRSHLLLFTPLQVLGKLHTEGEIL